MLLYPRNSVNFVNPVSGAYACITFYLLMYLQKYHFEANFFMGNIGISFKYHCFSLIFGVYFILVVYAK